MRILIADDDLLSLRILNDYINSWGYEVILCRNGDEAWAVLEQENRPNIAILDWMMPGLEGVQICERLRKMNPSRYVYVILLTARSKTEDVIKGLDSGADDYIIKPFHPEELKYRLRIGERIIELEQRIISMASTDYLTGLLNRRAFMERLEAEINRAQRGYNHLGIIIADLDHFKDINDRYGHQVGDRVLQDASRCLTSACRVYDFVGRYGGEEFIICLPGANINETCNIAERMRNMLREQRTVLADNTEVGVTASFGIADMSSGSAMSSDDLIKKADDALYQAKGKGRNQVVIADSK
ncbi:GGDEF domain-containing response regulator [Syntrophomonas palmitatica]|uniref:GGDEF domain-containing response regulator n=1 Tax=Syntrophomonas palmitatica TaxID=402877 RepID=UPI0006D030D4|nr:diguanylate cyclase [Syntrophomonas palmitatica]